MRAAVFRGAGEPLSIESVPDPSPEPGDLVLRVLGCGICGSDLHMSEQPMPPGMVMGHEYAGEIVEVGRKAAAAGWRTGERVCALPLAGCGQCAHCHAGNVHFCGRVRSFGLGETAGGYAEYVLAGGAESFRLPEGFDGVQGALIEPLAVGLHIVGGRGAARRRQRAGDRGRTGRRSGHAVGAPPGSARDRRQRPGRRAPRAGGPARGDLRDRPRKRGSPAGLRGPRGLAPQRDPGVRRRARHDPGRLRDGPAAGAGS